MSARLAADFFNRRQTNDVVPAWRRLLPLSGELPRVLPPVSPDPDSMAKAVRREVTRQHRPLEPTASDEYGPRFADGLNRIATLAGISGAGRVVLAREPSANPLAQATRGEVRERQPRPLAVTPFADAKAQAARGEAAGHSEENRSPDRLCGLSLPGASDEGARWAAAVFHRIGHAPCRPHPRPPADVARPRPHTSRGSMPLPKAAPPWL